MNKKYSKIDMPMLRAGFADNPKGFEQLKNYHPSKTN
jgi:hypothetical protein